MLRKAGLGWEFETEEVLEDFLCEYLSLLFQWKVLERQYTVNGQRCDVLAVDQYQRLVIIELKNIEDRGIVQQLTRYYDALMEEQPFCQQVSYDQSVHLVAIAPSFHRDNFIDRKYHTLEFQFLQFSVIRENHQFYLSLQDVDGEKISQVEVSYQEPKDDNLPPPPSIFFKYLADFDSQQKETILKFRRQLLQFDSRMQEVYSSGSIKYRNGTAKSSKYCAEFLWDKKYGLTLFLWLPYKGGKSKRIGRARIWTDWQDKALIEGYVSTGMGTEINRHKRKITSLIQALSHELQRKSILNTHNFYHYNGEQRYHYGLVTTKTRAKQYIQAVKKVYRLVEEDAPITYEDAEFIDFYRELVMRKTEYSPQLQPIYKSFNTLLNLALERWLNRL